MSKNTRIQKTYYNFTVPDLVRINKVIRLIKEKFPEIRGLNVLELGIARGGVADILSSEGAHCFGVDINPREIPGVMIVQSDLNEPFPDFGRKFDVVFAGEVMEHLFDDQKFLKECSRILKPGGILIVTVPNLFFSINRLVIPFGQMPRFAYRPAHYHIYNRKVLETLVLEAGFKILETISSHVLFSTRRNRLGKIFEALGDVFPAWGAHLIVCAEKN